MIINAKMVTISAGEIIIFLKSDIKNSVKQTIKTF